MSDLSEKRTNLPSTLTQDGKSTLRMKNQSRIAWSTIYGMHKENMKEILVWTGINKALKGKKIVRL